MLASAGNTWKICVDTTKRAARRGIGYKLSTALHFPDPATNPLIVMQAERSNFRLSKNEAVQMPEKSELGSGFITSR